MSKNLKSNTLFVSSLFKKNKRYLTQFINNINNQSDQNFDILFTTDNINYDFYLKKIKNKRQVILLKEKLPIKMNKYNILNILKKLHYKNIIFQDSDDTCDKDRIKITKRLLLKNNFIFCDVIIKKRKIFSNYFDDMQKIKSNDILKGNMIGFGNIAFKKKILTKNKLKKLKKVPNNIKAIDWITWLIFFKNLKNIIFSNKTKIFYKNRKLSNSSLERFNLKKFKENIAVQYETFKNLSNFDRCYLLRFNYIKKNYVNCNSHNFNQKYDLFKKKSKKIWFFLPT